MLKKLLLLSCASIALLNVDVTCTEDESQKTDDFASLVKRNRTDPVNEEYSKKIGKLKNSIIEGIGKVVESKDVITHEEQEIVEDQTIPSEKDVKNPDESKEEVKATESIIVDEKKGSENTGELSNQDKNPDEENIENIVDTDDKKEETELKEEGSETSADLGSGELFDEENIESKEEVKATESIIVDTKNVEIPIQK